MNKNIKGIDRNYFHNDDGFGILIIVLIGICLFLLTSCSSLPAVISNTILGTPTMEQTRTPEPTTTPTIEPTATIDFQQTAIVAKETSDEAMRVNVQVTAEQDRRNFEQGLWTVTAEGLTMQSGQFTATAYATSVPATQTAQVKYEAARGTELAMTIIAPTQIVAIAKAKAQAETESFKAKADVFAVICVGVSLVLIGIGFLLMVYRSGSKTTVTPKIIEPAPIPFVQVQPGPQSETGGLRLIRAGIPCSVEQLMELADGIVNRGMTLAFPQWEGTVVHKNLKKLRDFFVEHQFAKVLRGKGGELSIEAMGEEFLRDCLNLQSPPLPYICIE